MHADCLKKVSQLGDLFGRNRTYIGTVAFGPVSEDYQVLQDMATKLPRSTFQKLSLNVGSLKTAFSSLTGDLTTMNTEMAGKSLTVRDKKQQEAGTVFEDIAWEIYKTTDKRWTLREKLQWDERTRNWANVPLTNGVVGVAYAKEYFGKGGERYVYQCLELDADNRQVGNKLIAKESLHEEYQGHEFHKRFCRMQAEAEELAVNFNKRLCGPPEWQVDFVS